MAKLKKKNKTSNINIRISDEELEKIKKLAKKYAQGNVSLWVTAAALTWRPE